MGATTWTDEQVDRLTTRWRDGASCTQIAAELGGGLTRNAIIGKLHRLGITDADRPRPVARPRRPRAPRVQRAIEHRRATLSPTREPRAKAEPAPAPQLAPISTEHMRQFHELEDCHCRWPLWHKDTPFSDQFYCGAPTAKVSLGIPYCGRHTALAWRRGE